MNVVMIGPFGLRPKGTMSVRALPMAQALAARGHRLEMLLPPWSWTSDSGREWEADGVRVVNITLPPPIPLFQHLLITGRLVRRADDHGVFVLPISSGVYISRVLSSISINSLPSLISGRRESLSS